jgi:hypothetical protein
MIPSYFQALPFILPRPLLFGGGSGSSEPIRRFVTKYYLLPKCPKNILLFKSK